jgi:hypothetical protein
MTPRILIIDCKLPSIWIASTITHLDGDARGLSDAIDYVLDVIGDSSIDDGNGADVTVDPLGFEIDFLDCDSFHSGDEVDGLLEKVKNKRKRLTFSKKSSEWIV